MLRSLITIPLLLLLLSFDLQDSDKFPEIAGETLKKKKVSLPADTKGKHTLVGVAFSKKAEKDLQSWFEPVYLNFIHEPDGPSLFYGNYDVNLYFMPMFTGIKAAAAGPARKKMEKKIDPKLHPYILVYAGKMDDYKETLGLEEKDQPYFFVLNEEGDIIYKTSGAYTEDKLNEVTSLLE